VCEGKMKTGGEILSIRNEEKKGEKGQRNRGNAGIEKKKKGKFLSSSFRPCRKREKKEKRECQTENQRSEKRGKGRGGSVTPSSGYFPSFS